MHSIYIYGFRRLSSPKKGPNFHFQGGGGTGIQFPTFDADSKSAKTPKSHFREGGGASDQLLKVNFKMSSLSPKLKFPFPVGLGGGGGKWHA